MKGQRLGESSSRRGPRYPQVVVLVGATGDLSRRKLLPGLFHLSSRLHSRLPDHRRLARRHRRRRLPRRSRASALDEFSTRKVDGGRLGSLRAKPSTTCRCRPAPAALKAAVERAEQAFGGESRRVHYLSVPPNAALSAVRLLAEAGLVERSRIIMEKPFGTDLASAVSLNAKLHEVFAEEQIFRIDHFLGKEPAQNILAFRFANGLFEPIWNRNFIDHVQIDVPETLGLGKRAGFYEATGAYRDMVVTHLFQILGVHGDGAADLAGAGADQRGEEQGLPQHAADRPEGRRARAIRTAIAPRRASIRNPTPRPSSR